MKTRDIDQIIRFVSLSRDKGIYKSAAHFLQTCNFTFDDKVSKAISQFLSKAKDIKGLVGFYYASLEEELALKNYENVYMVFERLVKLRAKLAKSSSSSEDKLEKVFRGVHFQKEESLVRALEGMTRVSSSIESDMIFEREKKTIETFLSESKLVKSNFISRKNVLKYRLEGLSLLGRAESLLAEFNVAREFLEAKDLSLRTRQKLEEVGGSEVISFFANHEQSSIDDSIVEDLV